jgi:hypothetical protein
MKLQSVILLAAGLLAPTVSAQEALGSVTFEPPACGTDLSHPLDGFNGTDCIAAYDQLLAAHCTSGLCVVPSTETSFTQTVRTCVADIFFTLSGTSGATFNEAPVLDAVAGFVTQCTTEGDRNRGFPELTSTNGALLLTFLPSEGFE